MVEDSKMLPTGSGGLSKGSSMLLENRRIFIVEDDAVNIAIAAYLLRQHGATVFQDRWGDQALKVIRDALPLDLILLDIQFPRGVSGFDIFEHLRNEPDLKQIPVVAVSASGEMNRARDMGFAGYIAKPIMPYAFPRHLTKILDGTPVWADDQY